jgi:hypothetical protein
MRPSVLRPSAPSRRSWPAGQPRSEPSDSDAGGASRAAALKLPRDRGRIGGRGPPPDVGSEPLLDSETSESRTESTLRALIPRPDRRDPPPHRPLSGTPGSARPALGRPLGEIHAPRAATSESEERAEVCARARVRERMRGREAGSREAGRARDRCDDGRAGWGWRAQAAAARLPAVWPM